MASYGVAETEKLKTNVQEQLNRLLTQLQDLQELRHELDDDEYEETRIDTLQEMEEFDTQLKRLMEGNVSLVDALGSVKLALQAAMSNTFKTPEVLRMFASREPASLRSRLEKITQERRLARITDDVFKDQAVEIIVALKKLGEELTPSERHILETSDEAMKQFEIADKAIGDSVLSIATSSIKSAARK